ncbi:myosin II light chain [Schizosaccharomyces japonicus yFS275]|uniref:Myosin II light chain n=1 Tax=Schizosaccharomyces japonicus (strain yFS275 / FY16936) TaxID=402676 RepID=B6JV27_SCHJY|nr:myosin II light chain [Schizosaccharomyces japonicus yFS275]EEB05228.1 myosin II light chain [Schizosaccharomyces japonicus yFS275]
MSSEESPYKQAFSLFDRHGTGLIPKSSIGDLLRACGQNPTLAEIAEIESTLPAEVNMDEFLNVLNRPHGFDMPGDPEEFVKGFQVFDKDGSGMIGVGELRYVLTSLGEKLSNEEMDELLKGIPVKDGMINYHEFVQMILAN